MSSHGLIEATYYAEIFLTKGKTVLVDLSDVQKILPFQWHVSFNSPNFPYARRAVWDSDKKRAIGIPMHRELLGDIGEKVVDHKNGNTLDNRRRNLRPCNRAENQRNKKSATGSSSCFLGVSWQTKKGKWRALIGVSPKGKHLGYFDNEEDAARAYDREAAKTYGQFAKLNFPDAQIQLLTPQHES